MLKRSRSWKSRVRSRAVAEAVKRRSLGKVSAAGVSRVGRTWLPSFRVGGVFSASGPGRISVSLVVVALLFCHGAFGYAHQLPQGDAQDASAAHAASVHQPDSGEIADGVHPGAAYFATLLLLVFGTLLLLGGRRSAGVKLPVLTPSKSGHKVGVLPPPRGPTLPSLQVFRL